MRQKILGTFIITLFLAETFFIYPNVDFSEIQDSKDSVMLEHEFIPDNVNKLLTNIPGAFTENRGQLGNDEVRFYAQDGSIWFTDDGVWFEIREELSIESRESRVQSRESRLMTDDWRPETREYKRIILKQEFVGVNLVRPEGRGKLDWYSNFFYGNDSSKWCTNVPNFQEVYYKNLYNGIDLRYYTSEKGLKYDFIVHPGVNVHQIRMRCHGPDELITDESGNLIIKTPIEDIIDGNLFIYQDYLGLKRPINGRFIILNEFDYGFQISDDYNQQVKLIIDPLLYSTFIGGIEDETSTAITVDSKGNASITGWTQSPDFPTIPGSFNTTGNLPGTDAFIFKLKSNSSGLIYSTYIGGKNRDHGIDISVDSMGNAYITGWTRSSDFPTTPNAYNKSITGGGDCFVLKLNYNGSSLIYSTLIGGAEGDYGSGIVIDNSGNAYITGYTEKCEGPPYIDFPTTSGAYDETNNCNSYTAFIFKLSTNGSSLLYSTFLGGSIYEYGDDIAIDQWGNVYVTGYTMSGDFPTTPGAYDESFNINQDVFVSKLNLSGLGSSDLIYSTFVGGNYHEWGKSIVLDKKGNIIVGGDTCSNNFPTTDGAFDRIFAGGSFNYDCFIFKLNQNMSELKFSTYIGGDKDDLGTGISIDSIGDLFITGVTDSSNFPITSNAFDKTLNNSDIFLSKLSRDGRYLNYSTFLGGSDEEKELYSIGVVYYGYQGHCGIWIDDIGNIYLTGHTLSSDFPTTPGAHDRSINGKCDVFVSKFYFRPYINITSLLLLKNTTPINLAYSRLCQYTFQVRIIDTANITDIRKVFLILDPLGTNIQLCWDSETGHFSKQIDPNNYVFIESTSRAYNYFYWWTFEFNVIFNWSYPHEDFNEVRVYATSAKLSSVWLNTSRVYRVENDLMFNGTLVVKNENNQTLQENDLVRGGEILNWTGLRTVYENTTDVFPPDDEFDITIRDSNYNFWSTSPASGENFTLETVTASTSDLDGDLHIINISGIPPECDKTNETFTIRIDGDNVTFSKHRPEADDWQRTNNVFVGVTITDTGGGSVNNSSVMRCNSSDNGETWGAWEPVSDLNEDKSIIVQKFAIFEDGNDNLIKWRAKDSVGNGPTESEPYNVLVDTQDLMFSNAWPSTNEELPTENVTVGITISDLTSGVNASRIKYTVSYDAGKTWVYWRSVPSYKNGNEVNATLNLTFPNGTDNRIKWQAYDIAGNGPTESKAYVIKVNTWLQTFIPRVRLWSPPNSSVIPSTSVALHWRLENTLMNVTYDLYFDTIEPVEPRESGITGTYWEIHDLISGETYYWTVIPRTDSDEGYCKSGIWEFTVDISIPFPKVKLISPENGSIIRTTKPTFNWSLDYEGSENVTYNIYIDKSPDPLFHEVCTKTNHVPSITLEDNMTYYWKVESFASSVTGPVSETWSFTIKKDYIPHFELQLKVEPVLVGLKPGDISSAKATVRNLGELTDTVSLRIEIPSDSEVGAIVNEPNYIDILHDNIGIFVITLVAPGDIAESEVVLNVIATSETAKEYDQNVEVREKLTVKIITPEKPLDDKSSSVEYYWILYMVIILIIIFVIIMLLILRKKKSSKIEPITTEAKTIKPVLLPEMVNPHPDTLGPSPTAVPQLPETTGAIGSPQNTSSTTKVPTLASSTTPGQVPETQQIPQVTQVPQLPSPQPETSETLEESAEETTPESDQSMDVQQETDQNSQEKN